LGSLEDFSNAFDEIFGIVSLEIGVEKTDFFIGFLDSHVLVKHSKEFCNSLTVISVSSYQSQKHL
jgi:hypothetical protein